MFTGQYSRAAAFILLSVIPVFGTSNHLDFMVPDRVDTDLLGPVKSVDTKTSINVSGEFTRILEEYDLAGNLLTKTVWDHEGERLSTLANYYDLDGHFEGQIYRDFEDEYTNTWEVVLKPDTRKLALCEEDGSVVIYSYSPAGYLLGHRYIDDEKKVKGGSRTKRDDQNRRQEYTKLDAKGRAIYTYWFKWNEDGTIDRERQKYRKEEAERLHIYEYIKTDDHGNWTQRLMVRYDIGGKEKEKVFERIVTRELEYFEEQEDLADGTSPDATSVTATADAGSTATEDSTAAESLDPIDTFSKYIQYSFEELSDKVVIINTKSRRGRGSGSGFIARMDGKTYLFTNQHVVLGSDSFTLKTADGESLKPRGIELSMKRDIARIRIDDRDSFDISRKISLGMQVGVFGNSEGAGVATELLGEVTDFGADVVEITAEIVPGNSGSPVLNSRQEVIGIASHGKAIRIPTEGDDEEDDESDEDVEDHFKVRRFCYRLTDLEWKPVRWNEYNKKYGALYRDSEEIAGKVSGLISFWDEDWLRKIPPDDSLAPDLRQWIKEHNELVSRVERRGFSTKRAIFNAYADNVDKLADICRTRSRRIGMFATQRELTGFLSDNLEHYSAALDQASNYWKLVAEFLRIEGKN